MRSDEAWAEGGGEGRDDGLSRGKQDQERMLWDCLVGCSPDRRCFRGFPAMRKRILDCPVGYKRF